MDEVDGYLKRGLQHCPLVTCIQNQLYGVFDRSDFTLTNYMTNRQLGNQTLVLVLSSYYETKGNVQFTFESGDNAYH